MGRGVVAVGDSIIEGGTKPQFTPAQSWAQHLAEAGNWPFTKYARGGHLSQNVVDEQLARIVHDDYDVAAVTVGANDLLYRWDAATFTRNLGVILENLSEVAERVVVSNVPLAFRRIPGIPRSINLAVPAANDIVVNAAGRHHALVVDVTDFDGPRWMCHDRVHPTALGLAEMGRRAAVLLGMPAPPVDSRRLGSRCIAAYAAGLAQECARATVKRALGGPSWAGPQGIS